MFNFFPQKLSFPPMYQMLLVTEVEMRGQTYKKLRFHSFLWATNILLFTSSSQREMSLQEKAFCTTAHLLLVGAMPLLFSIFPILAILWNTLKTH